MAQYVSLYEAVGGMDALRRLCQTFYGKVVEDDLLAPLFANFPPDHVEHIAVWLAEVFGGPAEFTERLGGHAALLSAHQGVGIRDEHRARWLELMSEAIDEVLPERPVMRGALMSYFDWGTTEVQRVSHEPADAPLADPGPSPRWGHEGRVDA